MMRLEFLEKKHVAKFEEGGEQGQQRDESGDMLVFLIKALEDVPHEGIVGDRGADIGEGVGDGLLLEAVGRDALALLLYVAKLLPEVARVRMQVVVEVVDDAHQDGEGRGSLRHDHVGDVRGDGAVEPTQEGGVKAEPLLVVGGWDDRGEVVVEGVGADNDEHHAVPFGEVRRLEIKSDGDESLDTLDRGGLIP
jgi:hypothetical protein